MGKIDFLCGVESPLACSDLVAITTTAISMAGGIRATGPSHFSLRLASISRPNIRIVRVVGDGPFAPRSRPTGGMEIPTPTTVVILLPPPFHGLLFFNGEVQMRPYFGFLLIFSLYNAYLGIWLYSRVFFTNVVDTSNAASAFGQLYRNVNLAYLFF